MAEETNGTGTPAPQGGAGEVDVAKLQAQLEALQKERDAALKKAEQAVKDAALGRDRLREFSSVVRAALGVPDASDKDTTPWEERIRALEGTLKQRLEGLEADLSAHRAAAEAAKLDAIRVKIGAEFGLPALLVDRLQGETEKDLRVDAELMKKAIPAVNVSPMNPAGGEATASEMAKRLYERNRGPAALGLFTSEGNAALGGGILDFVDKDKKG